MHKATLRIWHPKARRMMRITLRPDIKRTFSVCQETDEGWSSRSDTYELRDGIVTHSWVDDGRDCDGRLTHTSSRWAHVTELAAVGPEGRRVPLWHDMKTRVYDQYAQAMGY